jgi:aspartokinase-like uncharacterized kinase
MSIVSPMNSGITVVKLGGSLMDFPDLKAKLWPLVKSFRDCLIVPGGGAAADEIRRLDTLASLSAFQSHWFAIAAMSLNAEVLVRTCGPGLALVRGREQACDVWNTGQVAVLDPAAFLGNEERAIRAEDVVSVKPLPTSWDVTSDSIAAWVAHRWPANRLILVKSCDRPAGTPDEWSKSGAVDAYIPMIAGALQIEWVNLKRS